MPWHSRILSKSHRQKKKPLFIVRKWGKTSFYFVCIRLLSKTLLIRCFYCTDEMFHRKNILLRLREDNKWFISSQYPAKPKRKPFWQMSFMEIVDFTGPNDSQRSSLWMLECAESLIKHEIAQKKLMRSQGAINRLSDRIPFSHFSIA